MNSVPFRFFPCRGGRTHKLPSLRTLKTYRDYGVSSQAEVTDIEDGSKTTDAARTAPAEEASRANAT